MWLSVLSIHSAPFTHILIIGFINRLNLESISSLIAAGSYLRLAIIGSRTPYRYLSPLPRYSFSGYGCLLSEHRTEQDFPRECTNRYDWAFLYMARCLTMRYARIKPRPKVRSAIKVETPATVVMSFARVSILLSKYYPTFSKLIHSFTTPIALQKYK